MDSWREQPSLVAFDGSQGWYAPHKQAPPKHAAAAASACLATRSPRPPLRALLRLAMERGRPEGPPTSYAARPRLAALLLAALPAEGGRGSLKPGLPFQGLTAGLGMAAPKARVGLGGAAAGPGSAGEVGGVASAGGGPLGPGSEGGGEGRRTSRAGSLASSQAAAAWAALGPAAGEDIGEGTGWDAPSHDH